VASITQAPLDLLTQMCVIDHEVPDPGTRQAFDMPDDQWFTGDRQQRLWDLISKGPHTLATTGGEDHGSRNPEVRRRQHGFLKGARVKKRR
jgi:hypothetical protein